MRWPPAWRLAAPLAGLAMVAELQALAVFLFAPEISAALGTGRGGLGALLIARTLALALAALAVAAVVRDGPRRAAVVLGGGVAAALVTLGSAFASSPGGLMLLLVLNGVANAPVEALHRPLLVDTAPPDQRVGAVSIHRAGFALSLALAPLVVAIVRFSGTGWRAGLLVMGMLSLAAVAGSAIVRDRGAASEPSGLRFFETTRRLLAMASVKRLLAISAVLGAASFPLLNFVFFYLDDRWGMTPAARSAFLAGTGVFTVAMLVWLGPRGDDRLRADPAALARLAAALAAGAAALLLVGTAVPLFAVMVVALAAAFGAVTAVSAALHALLLSVVPPRMRSHGSALAALFFAGVGGVGGLLLLAGMDRRFGIGFALALLAVPCLVGALLLRGAGSLVVNDLDQLEHEATERQARARLQAEGGHVPMLACRRLDFSYGQVQVLFDVDFTVDEGEMVALLGTNGAGKSTLLRVISGLGLPSRGSVHFDGLDVTFLDAERRVSMGITQVPGGRAVFGPMSVVDNLRVFGFTHGRDRASVERGIEATLAAFPALERRKDSLASTLSGGEQQMLGLGKAFILQPRVLLIDELSLGLAPKIVGELLEMVRRINAGGTAIVLVEQSVNIALSLVDHAYFMEKGEIRFDGRARDLLDRRDLLRSVFLEGAMR